MKHMSATLLLCVGAWFGQLALAQPVRVVTEDAPPYSFMQNGQIGGTATAVLEKTLQTAGIQDYRIQMYPWARAYDIALTEPNALIYMIARTPAREQQFQWVGEFTRISYHLYKLRGRDDVAPRDLDGARPHAIGVIRDDVRHQYLQRKGFARLVISAGAADNLAKLANRQVDLVPLTEGETQSLCQAIKLDCTRLEKVMTLNEMTTGLYMAYSKNTPVELVKRTQTAFDQLQASGTVRRLMDGQTPARSPATAAKTP